MFRAALLFHRGHESVEQSQCLVVMTCAVQLCHLVYVLGVVLAAIEARSAFGHEISVLGSREHQLRIVRLAPFATTDAVL